MRNGISHPAGVTRRTVLAGATAVLASPFVIRSSDAWAQQFAGKKIKLLTFSNLSGQLVVEHIAKPFEKMTGAEVVADLSPSAADMVSKVKASASNQQYDVVILPGVGGRDLIDNGLAEALDPGKVPNLSKVLPDLSAPVDGKALTFMLNPDGLIYNSQTFKTAPDSYEMLWDPKYSGRIVLPPPAWIQAMFVTILATRFAGTDVQHPEPGFEKLAELKDDILMLGESPPQVAEAIRANTADLAGSFPALFFAGFLFNPSYNLKATVRLKEGYFCQPQYLVMPVGHPGDADVIHAFMNFALEKEPQAAVSAGQFAASVNVDVEVPEDKLALDFVLPPKNIRENAITIDEKYLSSVRADWIKRYSEIFA